SEPDRESRCVHANGLCREKMTQLVNEDHETENQDRSEVREHQNNSFTVIRAAASAASNASRESEGAPLCFSSATLMAGAMSPKCILPFKNNSTACSFAALKT